MAKTIGTILWAGSVAGILDMTAAFVLLGTKGISPGRILQGIASGLLGARSYQGGVGTEILGGALHFSIAFSAAAIYYAASRRITFLTNRPILAGLLYGPLIYAFMNGVVLPLSALVPKRAISIGDLVTGVIILSCLVGLPISLIVWRSSQNTPDSQVMAHSDSTTLA
jgi:uncharacterized membrane protein YagU involved in acid resistance